MYRFICIWHGLKCIFWKFGTNQKEICTSGNIWGKIGINDKFRDHFMYCENFGLESLIDSILDRCDGAWKFRVWARRRGRRLGQCFHGGLSFDCDGEEIQQRTETRRWIATEKTRRDGDSGFSCCRGEQSWREEIMSGAQHRAQPWCLSISLRWKGVQRWTETRDDASSYWDVD